MFFIPLYDDNATRGAAIATWFLIIACSVVFLWQNGLSDAAQQAVALSLGMIPAVLLGDAHLPHALAVVPAWVTIFTSMFLHGGWLHIIGNMLFLWIFGDNVEDAMGRLRFLVFYFACGTVAALTQAFSDPGSHLPMIGASGAIAGVLGAYLMLYPRANVHVLMVIIIFIRIINVPAVIVLGIWFAGQLISAETVRPSLGGVAVWAHVGGFVAGVVLLPFFKRPDVPLFGAPQSRAFAVTGARVGRRGRIPTVVPHDYGRSAGPWGGSWR